MKAKIWIKTSLLLSTFALGVAIPTSVLASSTSDKNKNVEYEELSYDDLLQKLSSKTKNTTAQSFSAFDDISIHAGVGYINSFADIKTNDGTLRRHQNGMQLAIGMDLFSPNWYSEAGFKNFGVTTGTTDEISLKAIELKMGYRNQIQGPWSYTLNTGLSNRYLKFKNLKTGEQFESTTPSMLIGMGLLTKISPGLELEFDMNSKNPIVNETNDRGSYDFTIRMNAVL